MKTPQEKNQEEFETKQYQYLEEAEQMYGPKTTYKYIGLSYHNYNPQVIICEEQLKNGIKAFIIKLKGQAINDRTDGIFQLSHEVVHLLSPVEQDEGNEVNYLEEGMATYFSKIITERETENYEFCDHVINQKPKYAKAYQLYLSLKTIDENAVKKLRKITPIIANIESQDFQLAGLNVEKELIDSLLTKF